MIYCLQLSDNIYKRRRLKCCAGITLWDGTSSEKIARSFSRRKASVSCLTV
nr:MAG TPA: hypothetical protein [Inoviridae sp.]